MSATDLFELVNKGGIIAVLLLVIFTGYKGMWVFGSAHKDCVQEKLEWKRLALTSTHVAEKLTKPEESPNA